MNNEGFMKKADELLSQLSTEEKITLLCTKQAALDKIGFGDFQIGTELARGYVGREEEKYSTVFPQPIGLAGTFDTDLMAKLGEIAGNEARAYYNADKTQSPCLWGPTVDLERHPFWGRTEEGYGEDVCLAGEMTRAYTDAMAADNGEYIKTIPTLKHFCANNNEKDRGSCNCYLPLRLKYEYYYAAFMNAIKYGGAKSIMASYNRINGIPALCNPEIETMLKKDWGLWFTVTDGGGFTQNVTQHHYCDSHAETIAESIKAGCDVMTDDETVVCEAARTALAEGLLTEDELDKAVKNVLFFRLKLGELSENCPYNDISLNILDDPKSEKTALRAAREQIVLLKNDGILPLKEIPKKIAVIGALCDENLRDWYTGYFRNAVSVAEGIRREFPESEVIADNLWDIVSIKAPNGKYLSVHEDGVVYADAEEVTDSELFEMRCPNGFDTGWDNLFSVKYKKYIAYKDDTLKLSVKNVYDWYTGETFVFRETGNKIIIEDYLRHCRLTCSEDGKLSFKPNQPVIDEVSFKLKVRSTGCDRAVSICREADLVVYCMGNDPIQGAKECYDRTTLEWKIPQAGPIFLKEFNQNIVTVVISSFQYSICHENDVLPAIIYTTHAGAHLGTAVAETLSGKNNPAGRLAMTWYRSDLDVPDIMDYDIEKCGLTYMYFKGTPLYSFGYGLSYSEFKYKKFDISANIDGSLMAEAVVENVSDVDGDEVVQIYFSMEDSQVTRPIRKLCAFKRVHIKAHSEEKVRFRIKGDILQIYDVRSGRMMTESGKYIFSVGSSSAELHLTDELMLNGEKIAPRADNFKAETFDNGDNVQIGWSKKLKRHYVTPKRWCGTAVYTGINLADKTSVTFNASSMLGDSVITLYIGGKKYEMKTTASSSRESFKEYTVNIDPTAEDYMVAVMKEGTAVFDISVK